MLPEASERGLLRSYEGPLGAICQHRTQRGGVGEGAASRAKRVIVSNAARRCFNLPCWASRSSRGYPLREVERGVRKSHEYTAVRDGGVALYFRKRGAGVPLKGGG